MREIAVVGLACRFPNGLDSIDSLWDALVAKKNTAGDIPADRWEADRFFSADEKAKGMSYVKRGNFLKQDVRSFDAGFFDIPPKMAENLDPQQRLLLEVVWEAFENAGLDLTAHAGKPVGVYVGGFMLDHMVNQMQPANRALNNQNTAAGMMMTMLSNRISHAFDLRGPSLSIDTACSSSLVAFNYACQDIWNGTCDMAIVGGSNVMTRPEYPIGMSKGHFLARDGQCKSFDARGDGYGRGEGAGIVLLKALDQALADGDTILAMVAGTGANSDGRTPGISMPSAAAQRDLIVEVCERFQINPADVRYVECHGTGTAVGDPIEANSVGSVYGAGKSGDDRLVIGTIKSNIGHLEAAAGIAGVIKAVLSLMHGRATPLANLHTPHPDIPFDALGIRLADDLITLDNGARPVLAAVNSFGYGGTNAHAVLRTAPCTPALTVAKPTASSCCCDESGQRAFPYFLPISARSPGALKALAQRYVERLQSDDTPLEDIVHSAARRRAHLTHRGVVIGADRRSLVTALQALAAGESTDALCMAVQPYAGQRAPVFVYTGMGPQWWGMGQGLYRHQPIYRQAVDEADAIFQRIAGFSILEEMLKDEAASVITCTHLAQPANFIVQMGITAVLRAAGVQPGAIVGHSVGEVSSAYAAGALSLEEALSVSFHRSRLQATTAGTGRMLAVGLSEEAVKPWLAGTIGKVDVAAVNGPTTITLAGDSDAVEALSAQLTQAEVFNRALTVEVAYHSHLMDPILAELAAVLAHLSPRTPAVPLYSTVTGERVDGASYGADYWPLNVRRPVAFMKAIGALLEDGYTTFIEVGPHPVLSSALRDCAKAVGKEIRLVETLRRSEADECQRVMRGVAGVHAAGCDIDWGRLCAPARFVSLPNYPWQRERFWLESERGALERMSPLTLPMLGMQEIPASHMWRTDLENEALRYLKEHVVSGMSLMPAAGYLESLFELSALLYPQAGSHVLRHVEIAAPLLISAERSVDYVTAYDARARTVAIRSTENGKVGEGQTHVVAEIGVPAADEAQGVDLAALSARFARHEDVERYYKTLVGVGLQYGPRFQTIRSLSVHRESGEVLARIELDEREHASLERYQAHPTLMDGCFQTLFGMLDGSTTYLPTGFEELRLHRALPARFWCHGVLVEKSAKRVESDILLYDDDGGLLAVVRGLRAVAATAKPGRVDQYGDAVKRQVLTYGWTVAGRLSEPKRLGHWLVVEQPDQVLAQYLVDRLEAYGARVTGRLRFGAHCVVDGADLTVRQGQPDDIAAALAHLGRLDGVAFLHGLAATPTSDDPVAIDAITGITGVTQALMKLPLEHRPRVYAVTQSAFQVEDYDAPVSPGQTGINGFVRVAFNELEGLRFTSIDLPGEGADEQIDALAFELLCDAVEDEVALRRQSRFFSELQETPALDQARIAFQPVSDAKPVLVRPAQDKDESTGTIKLVQALHGELAPDAIELRIEALGLPISILSDPSSDVLDQAFVDVVATVSAVGSAVHDLAVGTRVCGFAPSDIGSHLRGMRSDFHLVEVDASLPAADLVGTIAPGACGVRLAELADVEAGAQVLVYADVKGVSLARELQRAGAQVVMVVEPSALEKLALPAGVQICPASHDQIERVTQATPAGFDVVAAPMADWSDRFGLRCLRVGGTLIDTAEKSVPTKLPPHAASMVRGDLTALAQRPAALVRALARCVALLAAGEIEPIRNLTISAVDLAWQRLESPNQDVQVVLAFGQDAREAPVHLQDRVAFHADASYLVTGGFGGFGQKTAQWLVEHGARHLVLVGRTGADTEERQAFVRSLENAGVRVLAAACDTADPQGMARLLGEIEAAWPPLRGIFHSAAVIIDQAIADLDQGTFAKVMRNKAQSAWVMHQLTRDLPLDHFVMYSSVANSVGNSRQASYSAANGFIDGLAWHRKALGLAATSVNWGAISDVGVVTRDEKLEQFLRYIGLRGITSREGLTLLGQALQRDVTQFGVTVITNWGDWARYETLGGKSPRFASLIAADVNPADAAVRERLRAELAALPAPERFGVLAALIVEVIAGELQTTAESISIDRPINELGVDSLMGTEIQLVLESDLGIAVSVLELLGDTSIRTITDRTLKDLDLGALEVVEVSLPG
jgi:acyl transferase domain-containing protein/NAD(P)-dependent dehydrogenase (short-subunit alcohol dehydrogenase family)/acyl carrier protein